MSLDDKFVNSDHKPQILKISNELSVMIWNILKKCTYYEQPKKFYNNGFSIVENEYQYHIRLKKIADEIYTILLNNITIKCIALQEMPTDLDLQVFTSYLSQLLPNFELVTNNTQGFLFDKSSIKISNTTYDLINKIGKNPHKIQSIDAITNSGEFNFINVHLCWFKSYKSLLSDIITILGLLNKKTIILGDFNFNILDVVIPNVKKYSETNTTLCNGGNGIQILRTCDGFLIYDR